LSVNNSFKSTGTTGLEALIFTEVMLY